MNRICDSCYTLPDLEKVEMIKIMPLGCPKCDIGGFLWQCPVCKKVVADWVEDVKE